jgi:hypothetical protein
MLQRPESWFQFVSSRPELTQRGVLGLVTLLCNGKLIVTDYCPFAVQCIETLQEAGAHNCWVSVFPHVASLQVCV